MEYNQLDPLLRATIAPEGDVNDDTGFSPFPGGWVGCWLLVAGLVGWVGCRLLGWWTRGGWVTALRCASIASVPGSCRTFSPFPGGPIVGARGRTLQARTNQLFAEQQICGSPNHGPATGNINQLVLKLSTYCAELHRHGGVIAEFVNPK